MSETLAEMYARHAAEMERLARPGAPTYAELLEVLQEIVAFREAKHSATYAVDLTDSIDRARRVIAKATGSDKP
jgi:hypothetical protein